MPFDSGEQSKHSYLLLRESLNVNTSFLLFSSWAPSLPFWVFCPSWLPCHQHPTHERVSTSLRTAHHWSPFSPLPIRTVLSHHITFHSPSVYGAFSSRQTLFEVLGTQQREKESKIPAWGLHSSGEKRKQTRDGDRVLLVDLAVCSREGPEGGKDTWVDETEAGDQWGRGGNSVVVGDRGQGGRGLEGAGAGRDGGLGGTWPAAGSRG